MVRYFFSRYGCSHYIRHFIKPSLKAGLTMKPNEFWDFSSYLKKTTEPLI